ncbi:MAG: heavy metal-binding domain-containing protein [Thermodesulfovibrionia bacterium]
MEQLIIFVILIGLGYTAGTIAERRHYRSIEDRELRFLNLPAVTVKNVLSRDDEIFKAWLVSGNVVISIDYFKRVLAGLRNIFGGEVRAYETLIDRARREAVLRMKESAHGANIILNLRIETSAIGQSANRRKSIGSIEAIAYGTAVTLKKTE